MFATASFTLLTVELILDNPSPVTFGLMPVSPIPNILARFYFIGHVVLTNKSDANNMMK